MSADASNNSTNEGASAKPKLMIVIASVRQGRVGLSVGRWFEAEVKGSGAFDIDLADLAEIDLPLMTEPNHPRLQRYTFEHTKAWSERVAAADAFVFVMPEYNFTFTAPLKNAIDYLSKEWANKPLGFLTYGGVSGGTRAMISLLPTLQALRIHPVQPAVNVPFVTQFVNDDGDFEPNEVTAKATKGMLAALEQAARMYAQMREEG
ncbi:MAG: NAD(P)H-dependent oxidoreductase [Trueperaceae bacterium]